MGETPQLFWVLRGLYLYYFNRAEHRTAYELGEQLVRLAQSVQDPALLVEAHGQLGADLYWLGAGILCRGLALAEQGHVEEGLAEMQRGGVIFRATGAGLGRPKGFGRLAEAYGKAGQTGEGLSMLTKALAAVHKTADRVYEAELHRLRV
jgi:hypothetical protein